MVDEEEQEAVPLEMLIEAARERQREQLQREALMASSLGQFGPTDESTGQSTQAKEIEELRKFGDKFRDLQQASRSAPPEYEPQVLEVEDVEKPSKPTKAKASEQTTPKEASKSEAAARNEGQEKPLSAQKKGQSEFVEFIEPAHVVKVVASNALRNQEYLEKRVSDEERTRSGHDDGMFGLISSSSNVLFVAFITMCCALSVVGVVGGTYYYRHVRAERDDPFDDFTRYSPAGPGKAHLKKGNFASEKGDEALAYRAQLHHYQQSKAKIIGGGEETLGSPGNGGLSAGAIIDDDTDKSEDEGELEHNYSVYECPGLAPTGDIEVQNPNFVDSATGSGKHSRVTSPQSPPHHH
jgi:hypothetical protein